MRDHAVMRKLNGPVRRSGRTGCTTGCPLEPLVAVIKAASLPCHAQHAAVRHRCQARRAACLRAHSARTPQPSVGLPSCPTHLPSGLTLCAGSRCAPDAPIAAIFVSRASPTPNLCRWALTPGFAVSQSRSVSAGRGSRGQPATALGGARALRPPSLCTVRRGTRRVLQRHSTEGTLGCSRGTLGVNRYQRAHTGQHAARNALPARAHVRE
jgi:hypothetical protein